MTYNPDNIYEFALAPPDTDSDDYFKVRVPLDNGSEFIFKLTKIPFQRNEGYTAPEKLLCRVKSLDADGYPVLTHVIAPYVYQLYNVHYSLNIPFECEVASVPVNPKEEPFQLRDNYGIFYRLNEPDGLLVRGQKVQCRFVRLSERYFSIVRVDEGARMPYFSPGSLMKAVDMPMHLRRYTRSIVLRRPEMAPVRDEIAAKQPRWLLSACNVVFTSLSDWLQGADLQRRGAIYRELLGYMRQMVLYLLEGSNFLNAVAPEERRGLQERLTRIVEDFKPFDRMIGLELTGEQDLFVEQIFDKLQKSGYLYHPARQFAILMLIFHHRPDKVAYYLSRIFESIFSRDLENWKREPFRSAFVEQFRIYVSQARRDIDLLPQAETRRQKTDIETVIIAIALELLLAEPTDDSARTYSLFFRYISLLRPLNTEALLSKAFLSLMGVSPNLRLNYSELKEPMMMMTKATIMPWKNVLEQLTTTHRFSNGAVELTVSSAGIGLSLAGRLDITERVVPEGLMPWLRPQIYLNGITGLTGAKLRKLPEHHAWWQRIETALFSEGTASFQLPEPEEEEDRTPQRAEIGDSVYIVIDSVDDIFSPNPRFNCHIEDTDFLDGEGVLRRDMIVGYNLKRPNDQAFRDDAGNQYGFLARIIGRQPDGKFVFSLRDEVDKYLMDNIDFNTEYVAVVTGENERDYSSIARDGFGFFIEKDPDFPLNIGDIVRCHIHQKGKQGTIRGYVTSVSEDPFDKFDKSETFVNIMRSIRARTNDELAQSTADDDLERDIDEILLPDHIRELVEIIRFKAIADTDLIAAYDYLRFARLLALIIADNKLADRLGTHARLLLQHQFFATNNHIDVEALEDLRANASDDPMLAQMFTRLELVSWLGKNDKIPKLFAKTRRASTALEGNIAAMVLSYNLMQESTDAESSIAANIRARIMEKLNVNNETSRRKYYGSESKYLEFKTSLVFPPLKPGEEGHADPDVQQFNILSRIAGMLNSNGGRLYLGVNNEGYEVGLHDDFAYYRQHKMAVGSFSMRIATLDNLCVYIENLINHTFGPTVARKISVAPDDEAEKDVILISIDESLDPVFIGGRLFVRQSGQSTNEYHGTAIDDFVAERNELKTQRAHLNALESKRNVPPVPLQPQTGTVKTDIQPEEISDKDDILTDKPEKPRLATSKWRPNVLHNWEIGYEKPRGYIYFTADTLIFSRKDLYMEAEDGCLLGLAVPHDCMDGFLVLGFEGERAMRIPLNEVIEKADNTPLDLPRDAKLIFAAIAQPSDALVCVVADSNSGLWRRAIPVSQIEASHATASPKRIAEAPAHHTVAWEIAHASAIDNISDCLAANITARRIGVSMRSKEGTPGAESQLNALTELCSPANQ